eukprot:TRINITY_DN3966_c0_g3_i3.p1 TRINITY_DN3966_c0_g3~~TRINITY_DN3966_c0_g3_i3.p1  ORF type:complete len:111 (-),score=0.20 TRINITY_DN3966_c0_g3_i3:203-535(-)
MTNRSCLSFIHSPPITYPSAITAPSVKTAEKRPCSSPLLSSPHILKSLRMRTDSSAKQPLITNLLTHKSSYPSADVNIFNTIIPQNVFTLNSRSKISNCILCQKLITQDL